MQKKALNRNNKKNNIVWRRPHGAGIFKDLDEENPAKRYKLIYKHIQEGNWGLNGSEGNSLAVSFSEDGLNWSDKINIADFPADTHNNANWIPNLNKYVAMTGEITLKGRVLPIGGLKEKLLAAIRYGIKTVIIPKENEKDLVEIQKDIQNKLIIKKVEFAKEVLDLALDGKISKINKKLDWRHLVTESMKPKNQQNQEKTFVN